MTNERSWRKSSYSGNQTNCVEVGRLGEYAAIRDTKNRAAGRLIVAPTQWSALITAIKTGRYDH